MSKDLILSYATDVRFDDLKRLLESARRFCPPEEVDIVVIINALGPKYHSLAEEHKVELIPCNSVWKEIRNSRQMRFAYRLILGLAEQFERFPAVFGSVELGRYVHRTLAYPWIHAQAQRYIAFEAFLKIRCNYRMIFLSDARDVVLQGNPFGKLDETKLHAFCHEPADAYITSDALDAGGENLDSKWVRYVFGKSVLDRLQGKLVICCGTTFGGWDVMMRYLACMTREVMEHKYTPLDQAISNIVQQLEMKPEDVVLHKNGEGIVLTLAGMDPKTLDFVDGEIRYRGCAAPVVHMYDRLPETNAFDQTLYPSTE
jgi:hypothetical protein